MILLNGHSISETTQVFPTGEQLNTLPQGTRLFVQHKKGDVRLWIAEKVQAYMEVANSLSQRIKPEINQLKDVVVLQGNTLTTVNNSSPSNPDLQIDSAPRAIKRSRRQTARRTASVLDRYSERRARSEKEAFQYLNRVINRSPNNAEALTLLGLNYLYPRDFEKMSKEESNRKAQEYFKRASESNLSKFMAILTSSSNWIDSYDIDERGYQFYSFFKHACELDPNFAGGWCILGDCYEYLHGHNLNELNGAKKAKECFERALQILDHPEIRKRVERFEKKLPEIQSHNKRGREIDISLITNSDSEDSEIIHVLPKAKKPRLNS